MEPLLESGLEFVTTVPNFQSKQSTLYRARHRALGVIFNGREDIILPEKLRKKILLFEDEDKEKILCFSSNAAVKTMTECSDFFC